MALERLVGKALAQLGTQGEGRTEDEGHSKPDESDGLNDFGGTSMQDFAGRATTAIVNPQVSLEAGEPTKDSSNYENLHNSISECDNVLKSVESYLSSFQRDLGAVSAEIETLQSRSMALNSKLENRRKVEKLLGPVVEQISLSPAVVKKLSEGAIDEVWVKSLEELQNRSRVLSSEHERLKNSRSVADLKPLIQDLSNKAVEKIRDYFASKIRALRSPNVNAQILQQHDFMRYRSLFFFLADRQPKLAVDISRAYVNTMRWYYASHFTRYHEALMKLKVHQSSKQETLGGLAGTTQSATTGTSSIVAGAVTHDPFNLGRRLDILRQPTNMAVPASTAEDSKQQTFLETPFVHLNLALLDNASAEYTFLTAFLPPTLFGPNRVSQQLTAVFNPTFEIGYIHTKLLIRESSDALGLLLAVRLTQHFAFTLQRRRVPSLDAYVNGTAMLLWPRFQQILDVHCESLKRLTSSLPSRPTGTSGGAANAAFATLSGSTSSKTASSRSTAPHKITQRFANLLRGILALSADTRDDEPVGNSVARLRETFEAWMSRMTQGYGSGEKGRRERERFVSSNYGLVAAVLEGSDVKGRLADDCRAHFEGARGIV